MDPRPGTGHRARPENPNGLSPPGPRPAGRPGRSESCPGPLPLGPPLPVNGCQTDRMTESTGDSGTAAAGQPEIIIALLALQLFR